MKIFDNVYVSADASVVAEKDFLVMVDAGCEAKTRVDVLRLSRELKRPLKYIFLSHYHWDHIKNTGFFRKKFPAVKTISNKKAGGKFQFKASKKMRLGGTVYMIIPTPGHSPTGNDICVYLPDKKILFTGDTCQPQGPSYHHVDFATPVPYYHDGDAFIRSLKYLLKLNIKHVITGHGKVFNKSALEITLHTTERIRDISRQVVKNNKKPIRMLCNMVFEKIAYERNYQDAKRRVKNSYYKEIDIHSMMYWVKKFKGTRK